MAASLLGCGLVLGGTAALAQEPAPPPAATGWVVVPLDRTTSLGKVPVADVPPPHSASSVNWRSAQGEKAPREGAPPVPWVVPSAPAPFSATPPVPPGSTAPLAGPASAAREEALPPLPPGSDVQQVLLQAQPGEAPKPVKAPTEDNLEYQQIQLTPPGMDRIFRRDSEKNLQERMRQEARGRIPLGRIEFPVEEPVSRDKYVNRPFPPMHEIVEPNYVCYHRLYFEDLNSERYGWDLGFFQPFLSTGKFFWDVAVLPYHMGTAPCRRYDCSAGYCLPGDPVPLLLYPPDISLTGAIFEAGTLFGLYAVFPG